LGLTRLSAFLRRHPRVGIDTSIFIYALEANTRYQPLTDHIFQWLEQTGHEAVTSTVTMAELLTQPYRDSAERRVDEIYGLLSTYPHLEWVAPDLETADIAARFRARFRLRMPDALQAATAVRSQSSGFLTNDSIFQRINAFETLLLDQLL